MDPWTPAREALETGETLVWADRPGPSAAAWSCWPTALTGVIVIGFLPIWYWQALGFVGGDPSPGGDFRRSVLALGALMNLAVGAILSVVPLWARRAARSMVYAITDRRALRIGRWRTASYLPDDLTDFMRWDRENGHGDIVFRHRMSPGSALASVFSLGIAPRTGFWGIPEVRQVEEALRQLKQGQVPTRVDPAEGGAVHSAHMADPGIGSEVLGESMPDEHVRWAGRPGVGWLASQYRGNAIVGAVFVLLGAAFLIAPQAGFSDLVPAALVIAAIGIANLAVPVFAFIRGRAMTYLVSDRRAAIIESFPRRRVRSFHAADLDEIECDPPTDSTRSTVRFSIVPGNIFLPNPSRRLGLVPRDHIGFYGIPDCERVAGFLLALGDTAPTRYRS